MIVSAGTDLAGFLEDLEGQVGAAPLAVCTPVCMLQPHLHTNSSCTPTSRVIHLPAEPLPLSVTHHIHQLVCSHHPECHTCPLSRHLCLSHTSLGNFSAAHTPATALTQAGHLLFPGIATRMCVHLSSTMVLIQESATWTHQSSIKGL